MSRSISLLFILFLTFHTAGQAQSDDVSTAKMLGARLHQGFVLIHSEDLVPVKNSYPYGLELDFAWHKRSESAWESCHCYPKMGIALSFWDYDDQVLGQGITSMFYIEPVFGAPKKVSFSLRAGFGLSYQNNPYDEQENPFNLSYSTYVAFPLQLGANTHFRLGERWYLDVSALYNHFSNGGIKEPNKGINWPSASVGVARYFEPVTFPDRIKRNWRESQDPQKRFDLTYFMAFQEPRSKLYLFSPGIELKYSQQISRINALTGGLEYIHDNGDAYYSEQAGQEKRPNKIGTAIGHEFLLGRTIFGQQFGVYLLNQGFQGADVYQRYTLVYRITEKLNAGIALKAHGHVADFLDFRVGWSLWNKNSPRSSGE
jgi:hypothetical protein